MAKCAFCNKETSFGKQLSITRSHISKRTVRPVKPNLRTVKANINGEIKDISTENGIIAEIGCFPEGGYELSGAKVFPGLIDIHSHGCIIELPDR